jgi:hypothetical protein
MLRLCRGQLVRLLPVVDPGTAPTVLTALFQADVPHPPTRIRYAFSKRLLLLSELNSKSPPRQHDSSALLRHETRLDHRVNRPTIDFEFPYNGGGRDFIIEVGPAAPRWATLGVGRRARNA